MSIEIQQPQPHDIVGDTVMIAGTAGGAFEANFNYRVTEGHDEVTGHFMAGDGIGGHGQFQVTVDVSSAAFTLHTAFVEVFHVSARDAAELDTRVVPVILGRLLVPGYRTYLEHVVSSGETLWSIAQTHYGNGSLYHRLVHANPAITNPNLISVGDLIRVPRTL
ncbi:LysM peptidoglycan-binding domain-containing protein [Janibacter cremeus]|uniref:Gmad2 immunoglobulin-like domain-containing protein n=1 Tax=Janibacter cremeus TaxID=1285192 RepID=UPI0023F7E0F7|nr:Gmad2 immunoglobulin-like domain-containing protein [Janibacter cremeus]WEV78327.1 LysM peptidoglycan-binding domain-containing protein [Janibacter cremeus]